MVARPINVHFRGTRTGRKTMARLPRKKASLGDRQLGRGVDHRVGCSVCSVGPATSVVCLYRLTCRDGPRSRRPAVTGSYSVQKRLSRVVNSRAKAGIAGLSRKRDWRWPDWVRKFHGPQRYLVSSIGAGRTRDGSHFPRTPTKNNRGE